MIKKFCGSILPFVVFYMWLSNIQHGDFTPISNVKGFAIEKLSQLHNIHQRRLMEPRVSPCRMEDVCNQIPEALGRQRGCYQKFMKNQDRLRGSVNTSWNNLENIFPRKLSSSSAMRLFPSECIFFEKPELKLCGKTPRCIKFPMFKDEDGALREPTWKTDWASSPWTR